MIQGKDIPEKEMSAYRSRLQKTEQPGIKMIEEYRSPGTIFYERTRECSREEEASIEYFLRSLTQEGLDEPEDILRTKAYALAHINILENTMLDTRAYLNSLGMSGADGLFEKELALLETVKGHALHEYDLKHSSGRNTLRGEIVQVWDNAMDYVKDLPPIRVNVQKAEC